MNAELKRKCKLLVTNRDSMHDAFQWNSGFFSSYRGNVRMPLLCKMEVMRVHMIGKMKKYMTLLILGSALFLTACTDRAEGESSAESEVCSTERSYSAEPVDAASLTEDELKDMSTCEIAEVILSDPKMTTYDAYNDCIQAMNMMRETYAVYRELDRRGDTLEILAELYDEVNVLTAEEVKENEENNIYDIQKFFRPDNVEILISSELYEIPADELTEEQMHICDRIMERSLEVQEIRDAQGDTYSMYSNGFYNFYISLAGSEYQEIADHSALMEFVPDNRHSS